METARDEVQESRGVLPVLLGVLLVALVGLRVLAPSDLADNDQPAPVAHIIDVARNGEYLVQRSPSGELMTKPPMYPWLGAAAVRLTGVTHEVVFKLPLLLAMLVTVGVVFDLGRRTVGPAAGWVAAGLWAANYAVFKLMYTARTDMLLAMWVLVAVWSVHLQARAWQAGRRSPPGLVALFWFCIAAGALTKGPPVLLALGWLGVVAAWSRSWRLCRPAAQGAGAVVATALVAAWLLPVLRTHPEWVETIRVEVTDRIAGVGTGAQRKTSPFVMPLYFVARWFPWAALFIVGAATLPWWRRENLGGHPVRWAVVFTLLVLAVFTIPRGKRADYILPSYAAAAVVAAAAVTHARRRNAGALRGGVHLVLGGVGLAGIAAVGAPWLLPALRPPAELAWEVQQISVAPPEVPPLVVLAVGSVIAGGFGVATVALVHRRRYEPAALCAAVVVAGMLGVHASSLSDEARTGRSRYQLAITHEARKLAARERLPLAVYEVGSAPIQALLGRNERMDASRLDPVREGGVLVAGADAWSTLPDDWQARGEVLLQTPMLRRSKKSLMLVRIAQPAAPSTPAAAVDPRPRG